MAQPGGPDSGGPNDPDTPAEPRRSGLAVEFCYRHPDRATGVHCTRCGKPICTDCMRPAAVGYQCPDCLREAGKTVPRSRRVLAAGGAGSVTRALMAINIGVFVFEFVRGGSASLMNGPSGQRLFDLGALDPIAIAHGQYWRLLTAMFLHANLLHIAFNMWALYILGGPIESWFGKSRFVAIYFVSGFLASITSFVFGPVQELGVGASGAIFGLLGAWLVYNYRRRSNPLAYANVRWAVTLIVINLIFSFSFHGIDWRAHVGGLVAGAATGFLAEGFGPRETRGAVAVAGFVGLLALGAVLTVARAATIRHAGL